MATFCTMMEIPETFEGLAWQFTKLLPSGYKRVDIVADTYQENSIKFMERKDQGDASKILFKSGKSKIPRDFASFYQAMITKQKWLSWFLKQL